MKGKNSTWLQDSLHFPRSSGSARECFLRGSASWYSGGRASTVRSAPEGRNEEN